MIRGTLYDCVGERLWVEATAEGRRPSRPLKLLYTTLVRRISLFPCDYLVSQRAVFAAAPECFCGFRFARA